MSSSELRNQLRSHRHISAMVLVQLRAKLSSAQLSLKERIKCPVFKAEPADVYRREGTSGGHLCRLCPLIYCLLSVPLRRQKESDFTFQEGTHLLSIY